MNDHATLGETKINMEEIADESPLHMTAEVESDINQQNRKNQEIQKISL